MQGTSTSKNFRWNDGISINYRNRKFNAYANYSNNYGKIESEFQLNRLVKDTAFNQQTKILLNKNNHVFKTGLDYTLSDKSNLGVMVSGNISAPEVTNNNTTPISYHPTGVVDRILVAENNTKQHNTNINGNINYLYKDTSGRTLVVNADYGYPITSRISTFIEAKSVEDTSECWLRISRSF